MPSTRKRDPLIYALIDPIDGTVRYVGQSVKGLARARAHWWPSNLAAGRQTYSDKWIKKLLREGLEPVIAVVERCLAEDLNDRECWWIAFARAWGCRLTNLADGGKSGSGWRASDEKRAKSKRAQNDPEVKRKIALSRSTEDSKRRHREGVAAGWADPIARKQRGEAISAAHKRPDVKERHRLGLIEMRARPEEKLKRAATDNRPEVKARRSASQKKVKGTPEARAHMRMVMAQPDVKARHSESVAKAHRNPGTKELHSAAMSAAWSDPEAKKRWSAAISAGHQRRREQREREQREAEHV